jgi:hypothetical protein
MPLVPPSTSGLSKLFPQTSQRCRLGLFLSPVEEEVVDIVYNYGERLLNEEYISAKTEC